MAAKLGPILNASSIITQGFGANPDYYRQFGFAGHEGVDLRANEGVIVASATPGSVLFAGNAGDNYGNYVIVWDAAQNVKTLYAHLSDIFVSAGATIREGDQIGHTGATGRVNGPHLHFGIMRTASQGGAGFLGMGTTLQSSGPLNPNNGYKGWENPTDGNLFDWPQIWLSSIPIGNTTPSVSGGVTGIASTGMQLTWQEIFAKYYAGWNEISAQADFNITMGGDINKLLAARGIDPNKPPEVAVPRPAELKKTYYLIPSLGGLSLNQINSGIPLGRTDVLGNFLGIDPNTKLTAGQALPLPDFPTSYYPSSSEWIGYKKLVGLTPIGNPGNYFLKPEYANKSLRQINDQFNQILGRSDVLAPFLGISEYYVIPGYQGFSTSGFPPAYIPTSSEWVGFTKVFQQGSPSQPKLPTEAPAGEAAPGLPAPVGAIPPETPPEVPGEAPEGEAPPTAQPPAGEGGADFPQIISKLDLILADTRGILAKISMVAGQPPTTAPSASVATGGLFVNSVPSRAAIYINGQFQYDYTPSNQTYQIKPGKYTLRLTKKGYKPHEQEVTIVKDETKIIEATFEALE